MKPPPSVHITALGSYTPSKVVTNTDLSEMVDTSDLWIKSHTGIRERHIAEKNELTSTLAYRATQDLLEAYSIEASHIDGIICATATPDYSGFPSVACMIAEQFGITGPAMDVSAGCTGFIYALEVARAMIAIGSMRNALVIGAEKLSSVVNWKDRNTCVLFGDGAGCALLEASEEGTGILDTLLKAEAAGTKALVVSQENHTIEMDGRAVYSFAVRTIGQTIRTLVERNNLSIEEIDWIVPHQANQRIIQACAKRYEIPEEKFYMNIAHYANTSAASIPLALREMDKKDLLKHGQKILMVGFGAGLTYGGTLLTWTH
ncbi:MAG: beta-ketoacyl-ACP synthase III [Sphaerochaetaceae bacterium]